MMAALLFAPVTGHAGVKCLSREGQCMAVSVNGQRSVKLGSRPGKPCVR
jgi:hypothetical protein